MQKKAMVLVGLFFVILCIGCNEKMPDTTSYKNELKDRNLMRVTDGQLTEFALKKGGLIADSLDKISNDKERVKLFADSLQILYGIKVTYYAPNEKDSTSKLAQVMEAYAYNVSQKIACEDNIQKISNDDLLFTRAILLKDSFMGVWAITMPKKELIKRITLKDIKK